MDTPDIESLADNIENNEDEVNNPAEDKLGGDENAPDAENAQNA